jgi:molecular chaperone DnaK
MGEASIPAVGIDLGTTFSVVAHLDRDGRPCTIPNAEGDLTTPSVVWFGDEGPIVGKEAVKAARTEPQRVAAFAKREMGAAQYSRAIGGEKLPPEVVQSLVLRKLKADAELMVGQFEKAVVTVPAYFNEPRRKATQDAGRIAGLDVIDIINEPTAAAIAYGVRQGGYLTEEGAAREPERILVYDLGGGTFDVTVMLIDGVHYQAIATAGDVFLGGMDWDNRIVDFVAEKFAEEHGVDPREDALSRQRLLQDAEDAKRALSVRQEVWFSFDHAGHAVRVRLSRDKFEHLTADLLDRTRFTSQRVLRDAGLVWTDLTRVLLCGGSSRMPMVREMLEAESGATIDRSVSVEEAVAHGAAIYAGMLLAKAAGERPRVSVTNVNSHDLGVLGIEPGTGRPRRKVLIPRNTVLPATHSSRFVTHIEGQKSVSVPVIEGGDASGNNATAIGKCVVKNLPGGLQKGVAVVVNFTYTDSGRLTVSATLPELEHAGATMTIQRASGLSDEQVRQWQERIAEGLRLPAEVGSDGPSEGQTPDAEAAATSMRVKAAPAASHDEHEVEELLDADATVYASEDTVEDAVDFLAQLSSSAAPPKPKNGKTPPRAKRTTKTTAEEEDAEESKPAKPPPPPTKASPPPSTTDGIPPVEDKKVDPKDDDALGDFLKGLG